MAKSGESLGLSELPPVAAELVARVGWLIRLRWLAVAGVVCILELARRVFSLQLALQPLYLTIAALATYNLILTLIFRRLRRGRSERAVRPAGRLARLLLAESAPGFEPPAEASAAAVFANVQIAIDLLFLALLLHFSGGIENPFVFFFILHVIVASILLSRLATFFHATLGLALVSGLALGELLGVLPHYPLHDLSQASAFRDPTVVVVQLFVLGTTLYLSAYLGSAGASQLRARVGDSLALSRKLAEKARLLEAAYQRASQSERAKSRYMRKVAHELRGPVGTIQTALKVVLQELVEEVPESSRELVARAERRAGDVARVTLDLLTLSQAREAPLEVEMMAIKPAQLVAEVVAEFLEPATRAGLTLLSSVPQDLGTFKADPDGLRQLVGNLLENAIRYTPSGGRVEVRMGPGERGLRLEVEDTGIGIPPEDLPRVFDEFFRAANARQFSSEGTGLGLAIVNAVAEQHGGSVAIDSTPGRGTLVVVDLSLVPLGRRETGHRGLTPPFGAHGRPRRSS
ncbi:MAG: HAMP domain-containing histidine kinase [Gemmatimonadota bacterium]|nr:MAG: HAMP domain-containing histidine kinase [Gemmatimonadota bacterium]